MKRQTLVKLLGNGFILLVVIILTYKFIAWNYWKVERAAKLGKGILNAPEAVNLTLAKDNKPLFQKGFAHNPQGNYYIINHFDITPYIHDGLDLGLYINHREAGILSLHRFKTFNIVAVPGHYFVFTTRDCGIEDFVKLRNTLPGIIKTLSPHPAQESGCKKTPKEIQPQKDTKEHKKG